MISTGVTNTSISYCYWLFRGYLPNNMIEEIIQIEHSIFDKDAQLPAKEIRTILTSDDLVAVIAQNNEERVVGYLIGLPAGVVYQTVHQYDAAFEDDQSLYMYLAGVDTHFRLQGVFRNMAQKFVSLARNSDYDSLTCHALVESGMSGLLQQHCRCVVARHLPDWCGGSADFISVMINPLLRSHYEEKNTKAG